VESKPKVVKLGEKGAEKGCKDNYGEGGGERVLVKKCVGAFLGNLPTAGEGREKDEQHT